MYNSLLKQISPATNKVLPKAGLNGFDWTFVQGSSFVLRLNFSAKTPAFGNTRNVSRKPKPIIRKKCAK